PAREPVADGDIGEEPDPTRLEEGGGDAPGAGHVAFVHARGVELELCVAAHRQPHRCGWGLLRGERRREEEGGECCNEGWSDDRRTEGWRDGPRREGAGGEQRPEAAGCGRREGAGRKQARASPFGIVHGASCR